MSIINLQEVSTGPLEQLLKNLPQKELRDFIIKQAQKDPQFKNDVLLEFSRETGKKKAGGSKDYVQIFRKALSKIHVADSCVGDRYGDDDDFVEFNVVDKWLDKAHDYAEQRNFGEAILICKAFIKEYTAWRCKWKNYIGQEIDIDYQEEPFSILFYILTMDDTCHKELFDFCKAEMLREEYKGTEMYDGFNALLDYIRLDR